MSWRLTLGISEDRDFQWPRVTNDKFRNSGPYKSALMMITALLERPSMRRAFEQYWNRAVASGSTLPAATKADALPIWQADLRWIAVMEAESARIWSGGPSDYRTAIRSYEKVSQKNAERIKAALSELRRFDALHPYFLRIAHQRALQDFLADEKVKRVKRPNVNLAKGYSWAMVGGPSVRDHEFQYITRMSLSQMPEMLTAWEREVNFMFDRWEVNWREFGALRFELPVSPKAAAKFNIAQLGLIARLSSRFRDFTAGYGIWSYSTGQPVPQHGNPCWDIVAEFINCALKPADSLTGDAVGRAWRKFSATHDVRMQGWPKPAKTEPQFQKK